MVFAAPDFFHSAGNAVGNQNFMIYDNGFLDRAQHVAGAHLLALFGFRHKIPFCLPGDGIYLDAAGDGIAHLLADIFQRALDAVVNLADQAGPQLHGQGRACGINFFPGADACRLFIYLNGGPVAAHFDDLADQPLGADAHHVKHIGVGQALGNNQRAGHFHNFSCFIHEKRQPSFCFGRAKTPPANGYSRRCR